MKRTLAAAVLVVLAIAPSAAAAPVEEVVSSGQVTATLSYDKRPDGSYRDFRAKIVRAGQTLVDEPIPEGCETCFAMPGNAGAGEKSIVVRDLDADGEPEVIASLFTGGAHCCLVSTLYGFQPATGAYKRLRRNWRDAGFRLRDIGHDGVVEFDSRDASFAYAFASYAESFLPLQIFRYREGRLVDVTSSFRRLVRRDAKRALRLFRRYKDDEGVNPRGFLAGWVADKYTLGQRRAANRALRRALRRGDLGKTEPFQVGPAGRPLREAAQALPAEARLLSCHSFRMAKKGKRKAAPGDVATNRQASHRYNLLEKWEAGLVLEGSEVKSLRDGGVQLKDAYAEIRDGEVWLQNMYIAPYKPAAAREPRPRAAAQAAAPPPRDRAAGRQDRREGPDARAHAHLLQGAAREGRDRARRAARTSTTSAAPSRPRTSAARSTARYASAPRPERLDCSLAVPIATASEQMLL